MSCSFEVCFEGRASSGSSPSASAQYISASFRYCRLSRSDFATSELSGLGSIGLYSRLHSRGSGCHLHKVNVQAQISVPRSAAPITPSARTRHVRHKAPRVHCLCHAARIQFLPVSFHVRSHLAQAMRGRGTKYNVASSRCGETGDFKGLTLSNSGPVLLGNRGFSLNRDRGDRRCPRTAMPRRTKESPGAAPGARRRTSRRNTRRSDTIPRHKSSKALIAQAPRPAEGIRSAGQGCHNAPGDGRVMTKTILIEAVTRRSAVQKMTVALDG
jgi:hypothetical protein